MNKKTKNAQNFKKRRAFFVMNSFKRAFGASLAVILLLLLLVFSFELVNRTVEKSGFSSGEVLDFSFEENVFSGEILGRKFSADFSPVVAFLPRLRIFSVFLPPFIRLGFMIVGAAV